MRVNATGSWFHDAVMNHAGRTLIGPDANTAIRSIGVAPAERWFVELTPVEHEDDDIVVFDLRRNCMGIHQGWSYRLCDLLLVVEAVSPDCGLSDVLVWVEAPDGEGQRVSGAEIETLMSVTGVMPVTRDAAMFMVGLPVGRPVEAERVRVALRRENVVCTKIVASIITTPREGAVVSRRGFLWQSHRLFRAPVTCECGEVVIPLKLPRHGLLQALVVSPPFVRDVALLLDDRELVCAPGSIARTTFMKKYGPHPKGVCLPLSFNFELPSREHYADPSNQVRILCGELDLSAPAVQEGHLSLRVRFDRPFEGDALVLACILRR